MSLRAACARGDLDEVETILKGPRDTWESELNDSVTQAISDSTQSILTLLLSKGAKLNSGGFFIALNKKNIETFQTLLDHGFDVNTREFMGEPALRIAVGDPNLVLWLLEHGADPNIKNDRGTTPLGTAVLKDRIPVVNILLSHGAQLDPDILHRAMRQFGNSGPGMVQHLISKGADVNHIDEKHGTPLHWTAYLNLKQEAAFLLEGGADPTIVCHGYTPAELAKMHGHMEFYDWIVGQVAPNNLS